MIRAVLFACVLATPTMAQGIPAEMLYQMMPTPQEGWTSAQSPDAEGMAGFLGGTVAVQDFSGPDGARFQMILMIDGQMAQNIAQRFSDPAQLAQFGTVTEIDGFSFLHQDDTVTGAIGPLTMQTSGTVDPTPVYDHLRGLDLSEIASIFEE